MFKSFFMGIVLFCFSNIILYSQVNPDSTMTDEGYGGFYLSYSNLNTAQNYSILIGGGVLMYDINRTRFFQAEFLFPIGENPIEIKSPFVDIKAGIPLFTFGNYSKRKKSVEFLGGMGVSSFFFKDVNNKTISQMGFQPFIGISFNFGHILLRSTAGPIFSTGNAHFNAGSLNIGYQF